MKKTLSAFSVSAAALSLVLAEGVQADQLVDNQSYSDAPVSQSQPQAENTQKDESVSKEQVDAAQALVQEADSNVAQGKADLAQAQANTAAAQSQVEQAQAEANRAQEAADKAGPEAIETARQEESNQKAQVDSNKSELAKADQATKTAEAERGAQAAKTKEAQEQAKTQEGRLAKAQNDVKEAQANLSSEATSKAEKNVKAAQDKVAADQSAVETAQAKVATARQTDSQKQAEVAKAQTNQTQAKTARDASQKNLQEKTAAAEKTQSDLNQAQQALQKAQAGKITTEASSNKNRVSMTPEYIAALRELIAPNLSEQKTNEIQNRLAALNASAKALNRYVADPTDSKALIDTNNIPQNVRQELSQFASELINQLRAQMGTGEVVVTPSSIDFADKVATEYRKDNWNWDLMEKYHHDAKAINRVAREYGLMTTSAEQESKGLQYYENAYIWREKAGQMSVAEMKRRIYDSVVEFMFNGYEWLHATSISGLNTGRQKNYLGVDFSMESDITMAHFTMVSEDQVKYASKKNFNASPITGKAATAKVDPQEVAQAQTAYDAAFKANQLALASKGVAQSTYNRRAAALEQANQQLAQAQAQAGESATAQAQAALAAVQEKLAADQAALAAAQAALQNSNLDDKTKAEKLTQAQEALTAVQATVAAAQEALKTESDKLAQLEAALNAAKERKTNLEKAVTDAEAALQMAKESLSNLENAKENLEQAKSKLAVAQAAYQAALTAQTDQEAKVAVLTAVQAQAKATYDLLAQTYAEQNKEEDIRYYQSVLAHTEERFARSLPTGQARAPQHTTVSTTGTGITESGTVGTGTAGSASPVNHKQAVASGHVLPKTGENSSWLLLAGQMLLLMAMKLFYKKRSLD